MVPVEDEAEVAVVVVNVNVDCTMGGSARLMQRFLNCNTLGEVTVTLYIENGVYLFCLFLLFC